MKVETSRPDNILFLLYINKMLCYWRTRIYIYLLNLKLLLYWAEMVIGNGRKEIGFKGSSRGRIEVIYSHLFTEQNKTTETSVRIGSASTMIPNGQFPKKCYSVTTIQNKLVTADVLSQNSGLLGCDTVLLCWEFHIFSTKALPSSSIASHLSRPFAGTSDHAHSTFLI